MLLMSNSRLPLHWATSESEIFVCNTRMNTATYFSRKNKLSADISSLLYMTLNINMLNSFSNII